MFSLSNLHEWKQIPYAGEWKEGNSELTYDNINPYTEEILLTVNLCNKTDIEYAIDKAKLLQKDWAKRSPEEREKVLLKAAQLFEEQSEEVIQLLVRESGSTYKKASFELGSTVRYIREAATFVSAVDEMETRSSFIEGKENYVYRKPKGVVGVITPWNFPLNLAIRSVGPALATGNAIILKPDLQTFISGGSIIAKIFEEAGLPKGLISVVPSDITEIENILLTHPDISLISFTGSTQAGKIIARECASNLKEVILELGGNNPFVVLNDANLDQAVEAATFSTFLHQGQICMSVNRIIVEEGIYDKFIDKFKSRVTELVSGDPMDKDTTIGPLINNNQLEKIEFLIDEAEKEGASVLLRGKRTGNVLSPSILTNVKNSMDISCTEIFGPVAIIIKASNKNSALNIAAQTEYGLTGAVFTQNVEEIKEDLLNINSGMFHINDVTVNSEPGVPFGGEKHSGIGRHGGEWSIDSFTQLMWISNQLKNRKYIY